MKNLNNYLVIGVIILMSFVGLGSYYRNHQKQTSSQPVTAVVDSVDTWKTYTDTNVGFSLKYPSDYFVYQGDPALGFTLTTSAPEGDKGGPKFLGENDARFGASSADFSFQTLDDYLSNQETLYKDSRKSISKESVMIGGIAGYKVTYAFQTKPEGSSATTLYASDGLVIKNGKRYSVSLSSFNQKLLESKQAMFDQILSTFQFTQQTANVDNNAVSTLVKNFYKALESQDGKLLFSYFTPPSTDQEKKDLSWLTGTDRGGGYGYRVFIRSKILNPKISDTREINATTAVVTVTDQVQGLSNAGLDAGWSSPKTRLNVFVTVVKSGDTWFVDKFMDPTNTLNTGNAGSSKYNGFGQ